MSKSKPLYDAANRPPQVVVAVGGGGRPPLDDDQCEAFVLQVEAYGGMPHGFDDARRWFLETYTVKNGRWVAL